MKPLVDVGSLDALLRQAVIPVLLPDPWPAKFGEPSYCVGRHEAQAEVPWVVRTSGDHQPALIVTGLPTPGVKVESFARRGTRAIDGLPWPGVLNEMKYRLTNEVGSATERSQWTATIVLATSVVSLTSRDIEDEEIRELARTIREYRVDA